jgi:hypothetical protein
MNEMDAVQLAVYAWATLEDAAHDMPNMPVAELFDRFLAWARKPVRPPYGATEPQQPSI